MPLVPREFLHLRNFFCVNNVIIPNANALLTIDKKDMQQFFFTITHHNLLSNVRHHLNFSNLSSSFFLINCTHFVWI